MAVITIRIRHPQPGVELEVHQAADQSLAAWVHLEPELVSGEKIGSKRAWCEGLANTVRDMWSRCWLRNHCTKAGHHEAGEANLERQYSSSGLIPQLSYLV